LHKLRAQQKAGDGNISVFEADVANSLVYLPPDSPELRTLLSLKDVELAYQSSAIVRLMLKERLWADRMSDK
jgi:hypothetical protein